jgi:hypothetical protein
MTGINADTVYSGIGAAASDNGGCAVLSTSEYGYENWLSLICCLPAEGLSNERVGKVLAICPDSYMVWVGVNPVSDGIMSLSDFN